MGFLFFVQFLSNTQSPLPNPCPLSPFPLSPRLSSLVLAPKLLGLGRKISEIGYRLKYVRLSHVKYLSRAG